MNILCTDQSFIYDADSLAREFYPNEEILTKDSFKSNVIPDITLEFSDGQITLLTARKRIFFLLTSFRTEERQRII